MADETMTEATREERITPKRLFDMLFNMTDEAFQKSKIGIIEKKAVRKFEEAYDDAETRKINSEENVTNMLKDITNLDVNALLRERQHIKACVSVQEDINDLYNHLFNESIKR